MNKELLEYFNQDELASSVWLGKYADGGEITPTEMHKRMAKEFYRIDKGYQDKEFTNQKALLSKYGIIRKALTEDDIFDLFKDFGYVVPQGSVMSGLGTKNIVSLSNCVVLDSPLDSYNGILYKDFQLTALYRRRNGVGFDISNLRPNGTFVNNSAKSSTGAVSFVERFSNTTREVAMNGRRGALMLSMDVRHPDILEFIKCKQDLTKVTGANISVRLNDEFMEAVEKDKDYWLRFPCDVENPITTDWVVNGKTYKLTVPSNLEYNKLYDYESVEEGKVYIKKVRAKDIWNTLAESAHKTAEPGILFWDNMISYSPDGVYDKYRAISTNPCSEIGMSNDSCRLMALNLFTFVDNKFTDKASFNYELFYRTTYEAMRLMDNLVDLEIEAIDKILAKIKSDPEPDYVKTIEIDTWKKLRQMGLDGRRTGLGFTALADTLAALGMKYGSDEFLKEVDQIMNYKMRAELDATIDLAILRGTFEGWDIDEEFIISNNEIWAGTNDWYDFVFKQFPEQAVKMINFGRRNVSFSTIAPTGSLSLLTQTTSGIEPLFQPWYTRRKKINPNEQGTRVDYVDDMGDSWTEYFVLHPKFKEWLYLQHNSLSIPRMGITGSELVPPEQWEKEILEEAFKYSPWYGSCANDIDWKKRIEVQAICQKYTTHSISSTINLPKDVSVETVSNIYFSAWEQGLKGLTVYRDGSRSGVLVTEPSTPKFQHIKAPKRPKKVEGEATLTKAKGEDYTVFVGFMEGNVYEVFAYKGNGITGTGKIVKKAQGHYVFVQEDIEFEITDNLTDEQEAITRGYSWGLRHGGGIEFAVEQLNKTKGSLVGFNKALARVLKKYIPKDAIISDKLCPACGEEGMVYEEGCLICKFCGHGKC